MSKKTSLTTRATITLRKTVLGRKQTMPAQLSLPQSRWESQVKTLHIVNIQTENLSFLDSRDLLAKPPLSGKAPVSQKLADLWARPPSDALALSSNVATTRRRLLSRQSLGINCAKPSTQMRCLLRKKPDMREIARLGYSRTTNSRH